MDKMQRFLNHSAEYQAMKQQEHLEMIMQAEKHLNIVESSKVSLHQNELILPASNSQNMLGTSPKISSPKQFKILDEK